MAIAILAMFVPILIAVPLFVLAALLIAWGLQPRRTEEFVGRLPYGSSYILKALANLDSMLSKFARVTDEQLDAQKNVVAPDDQDQTPQSAAMQPTAPAIPEPGELEIEPPNLQPRATARLTGAPGSAASAATGTATTSTNEISAREHCLSSS